MAEVDGFGRSSMHSIVVCSAIASPLALRDCDCASPSPAPLLYHIIHHTRPKTVNEMLHAARLSLAATPSPELPLNRVAHVDADPRAAPIQLGRGGEESEDGLSLESNQRPWLEESPLPRRGNDRDCGHSPITVTDVQIDGRPRAVPRHPPCSPYLRAAVAAARPS
eukprot:scaffold16761_cov142-Isochrysis_galbana.AAC.3